MEYKQVILIRTDLKMSKGKLCAQTAHASLMAALKVKNADKVLKKAIFSKWKEEGMKKVVLKVSNKEELFQYKDLVEREGIKTSAIKDAGLTEVPPGTYTSVGIGPDKENKIDRITGKLKPL